jgi:hypothetical protein
MVIIKWAIKEWGFRTLTEFVWLKIESIDGSLWTRYGAAGCINGRDWLTTDLLGRVQLKCDGTRWRREGKWRGDWRMEWVASTLRTTPEHGVSGITTADVHTSAVRSRLNWRPRRFKWSRPFRRKTNSGFYACAITFQTQSTSDCTLCDSLWVSSSKPGVATEVALERFTGHWEDLCVRANVRTFKRRIYFCKNIPWIFLVI